MNERYLFRGKRIDSLKKDWIIGHYVSVPRPMIISTKTRPGGGWDFDDVDPTTVGECTGMRDNHGSLIFEGDIVRTNIWDFTVIFDNACFWLDKPGVRPTQLCDFFEKCVFLIIGNIHELSELIEGGDHQ